MQTFIFVENIKIIPFSHLDCWFNKAEFQFYRNNPDLYFFIGLFVFKSHHTWNMLLLTGVFLFIWCWICGQNSFLSSIWSMWEECTIVCDMIITRIKDLTLICTVWRRIICWAIGSINSQGVSAIMFDRYSIQVIEMLFLNLRSFLDGPRWWLVFQWYERISGFAGLTKTQIPLPLILLVLLVWG